MLILDDDTSIRKDLFGFFSNPDYQKFDTDSTIARIIVFIKILILSLLVQFICNLPLLVLESFDFIEVVSDSVSKRYEWLQSSNSDFLFFYSLNVVLIGPILEEIGFRLPLGEFKASLFKVGLGIIFGSFLLNAVGHLLWWPQDSFSFFITHFFYYLFTIATIYFLMSFKQKKVNELKGFWDSNPSTIVYISAIAFAFSHYFNFDFEGWNYLQLPFIMVSFFVSAIIFSYLRIRLGLVYSIVLHFAWNGLFILGLNAS